MVANTLEGGHRNTSKGSCILAIESHVVKHQVAQGICHHLTLTAESIDVCCHIFDCLRFPTLHVMLSLYLWVGDSDIVELIHGFLSLLQGKVMFILIACQLIDTHIKALGYALLNREYIGRRSGDTHKLANVGIRRQSPFTIGISGHKLHAIVNHDPCDTLAFTVLYLTRKEEGRDLLG